MKIAFGLKAHSGWAALVVLGKRNGQLEVVDRRRLELVEEGEAHWAKQPYHSAEELDRTVARGLVKRGIQAARRSALREMRLAVKRAREAKLEVAGCAVLIGEPMPDWTVDEILNVHFRMHKAEGVMFQEALTRAAGECGLTLVPVREKLLNESVVKSLKTPLNVVLQELARLGKAAGPPWGKDQKEAALAAMIALEESHAVHGN